MQKNENLAPKKLNFGAWYSAWYTDPAKIGALNFITALTNKNDILSFLCMMQSNFAQKAAPLRELTHQNSNFKWKLIHQKCFESLIPDFKKDALFRYSDMRKKIFVIAGVHITSLGEYSLKEILFHFIYFISSPRKVQVLIFKKKHKKCNNCS